MSLAGKLDAIGRLAWSGRLDRNRLERLQARRLSRLLTHAASTVPYYRDLFARSGVAPGDVRGPADLAKLPISTKADLQAAGLPARTSTAFAPCGLQNAVTSGSSGRPFTVRYDPGFVDLRQAAFLRAMRAAGYRPGQRVMLLSNGERRPPPRWLRWHHIPSEQTPEEHLGAYLELRPAILYGFRTPLAQLALAARPLGDALHRPRAVVSTAESLDRPTRRLLGEVFGAPVHDLYGMTETGLLGWQCTPGGAYHLAEDVTIVELLTVPGQAARRIVVTVLGLLGTPMIRYDTGDLAVAGPDRPCDCGCTLARVLRIEGRLVDCVHLPGGSLLSPYHLTEPLEERLAGIDRFQVIQEAPDAVTVRLQGPRADTAAVAREVEALLRPILGHGMAIRVVRAPSLDPPPGHKFRAVECRLDRRSTG
ncbi:phenylacetate--CoA ligase family protein [Falsiroseomonas sp. E2-1-a20]|uniref:phenylacetate--CoA ligase family protein n=1 Tax=Falsiroseomonas sp. E2-1-a20 TaxID=3239300 RepID=UPI003F3F4A73